MFFGLFSNKPVWNKDTLITKGAYKILDEIAQGKSSATEREQIQTQVDIYEAYSKVIMSMTPYEAYNYARKFKNPNVLDVEYTENNPFLVKQEGIVIGFNVIRPDFPEGRYEQYDYQEYLLDKAFLADKNAQRAPHHHVLPEPTYDYAYRNATHVDDVMDMEFDDAEPVEHVKFEQPKRPKIYMICRHPNGSPNHVQVRCNGDVVDSRLLPGEVTNIAGNYVECTIGIKGSQRFIQHFVVNDDGKLVQA